MLICGTSWGQLGLWKGNFDHLKQSRSCWNAVSHPFWSRVNMESEQIALQKKKGKEIECRTCNNKIRVSKTQRELDFVAIRQNPPPPAYTLLLRIKAKKSIWLDIFQLTTKLRSTNNNKTVESMSEAKYIGKTKTFTCSWVYRYGKKRTWSSTWLEVWFWKSRVCNPARHAVTACCFVMKCDNTFQKGLDVSRRQGCRW